MAEGKILVVDDEDLLLVALSRSLREAGHRVTAAESAEEALAKLENGPYDLCFLDLRLPGMDGLSIADLIRRKSPAATIVIMTASLLNPEEQTAVDRGADFFLEKPFDLVRVKEITERALGPAGRFPRNC